MILRCEGVTTRYSTSQYFVTIMNQLVGLVLFYLPAFTKFTRPFHMFVLLSLLHYIWTQILSVLFVDTVLPDFSEGLPGMKL